MRVLCSLFAALITFWPLALHAPQLLHPGAQRSFAELWKAAQIDQQLWPVAFVWRGQQLTPASLLDTFKPAG